MVKKIVIEKKRSKEDKKHKLEKIEEAEDKDLSSDDGTTDSESSSENNQPPPPQSDAKPKRKVNYVMTEARKKAFEKAKEIRLQNIAKRNEEKTKEQEKYNKYKEEL